ncbi:MAG: hypothetical protein ACI4OC_04835 [Coriobacteriales bacterium]
MPSVVLTARVDQELKARAALGLEQAGLTASLVIQELWAFLARHAHEPEAVRSLLATLQESSQPSSAEQRIAQLQAQQLSAEHLAALYGIVSSTPCGSSSEELALAKEEAYAARFLEQRP